MKKKQISLSQDDLRFASLRCVYCRRRLSWQAHTTIPNSGTLSCPCDVYPVLEGVAYLKKDQYQQRSLKQLLQSQPISAVSTLLRERKKVIWLYLLSLIFPIPWQVFLFLLRCFNPETKDWIMYLKQREKRITYLLSVSCLSAVKEASLVIDLGCGTGHFLREAVKLHPLSTYVGIDTSFPLLYLARKFFLSQHHNVLLICADLEKGTPIISKTADTVFMNDAFMYVQPKKTVLKEIHRTLRSRGLGFITHIHHESAHNLGQGLGSSRAEIRSFKLPFPIGISADSELIRHIVHDQELRYQPVENGRKSERSYSPSFSLILGQSSLPKSIPVSAADILFSRNLTGINFTEDEYLRSVFSP